MADLLSRDFFHQSELDEAIGFQSGMATILRCSEAEKLLTMFMSRGVQGTDLGDRVEFDFWSGFTDGDHDNFGFSIGKRGDKKQCVLFEVGVFGDWSSCPDFPVICEFVRVLSLGTLISLPAPYDPPSLDRDEYEEFDEEKFYTEKLWRDILKDPVSMLQRVPTLILQEVFALRKEDPQT